MLPLSDESQLPRACRKGRYYVSIQYTGMEPEWKFHAYPYTLNVIANFFESLEVITRAGVRSSHDRSALQYPSSRQQKRPDLSQVDQTNILLKEEVRTPLLLHSLYSPSTQKK